MIHSYTVYKNHYYVNMLHIISKVHKYEWLGLLKRYVSIFQLYHDENK